MADPGGQFESVKVVNLNWNWVVNYVGECNFCKQFKIDEKMKFSDATQRAMKYNMDVDAYNKNIAEFVGEKKREKINVGKLNMTLMLLKNHTWEELVKMKYFSRSTMYSQRAKLKKIGIAPNQLAVDTMDIKTNLKFDRYIESYFSDQFPLKMKNNYFL